MASLRRSLSVFSTTWVTPHVDPHTYGDWLAFEKVKSEMKFPNTGSVADDTICSLYMGQR